MHMRYVNSSSGEMLKKLFFSGVDVKND